MPANTEDLKEKTREVHELHNELKTVLESKTAESAEAKEKIAKIDKKLDKHEEFNQKLVAEIADNKKSAEEFKKYCEKLDKFLSAPNNFGTNEKEEKVKIAKAFNMFAQLGEEKMAANHPEELKYLRTDNDPDGGFLVPGDFNKEIIKNLTEISLIRKVARVKTTMSNRTKFPVRTNLLTSGWVGEGEEDTESNSKYGANEIFMKKMQVTSKITVEDLQDSAFDMEAELGSDVGEEFARREGIAFVKGSGNKNVPEGFMTNANVPELISTALGDFLFNDLITLTGELKTGYTPMYGWTRRTLARIRKFQGNDGHYIWTPGNMVAGVPNAVNGSPYMEIPNMDEIGSSTYPVIYADFLQFYYILDRVGVTMIRDPFHSKREGKVEFTFFKRTSALVQKPEAGIKLKCGA